MLDIKVQKRFDKYSRDDKLRWMSGFAKKGKIRSRTKIYRKELE